MDFKNEKIYFDFDPHFFLLCRSNLSIDVDKTLYASTRQMCIFLYFFKVTFQNKVHIFQIKNSSSGSWELK
jgi:hypothetical protein